MLNLYENRAVLTIRLNHIIQAPKGSPIPKIHLGSCNMTSNKKSLESLLTPNIIPNGLGIYSFIVLSFQFLQFLQR
jgi:hypothetical protein